MPMPLQGVVRANAKTRKFDQILRRAVRQGRMDGRPRDEAR